MAHNDPSPKPLILVDGSSYLYRAFHALPALSSPQGEPTGAVFGVANMLKRLLSDYDPWYLAVVFDAKGKTFRDELYSQYKANRPPMPEELSEQIAPLLELIDAMGLPALQIEGVEADDVIGTLARVVEHEGIPVVVSTGDKDLAQLVSDRVTLVNTMDDTTLDRGNVAERFGVPPERIVDFLALTGDKVDNIPGVPGVGPKTAAKWLAQYGSLEAVMAHAQEIKGKAGANLRGALDTLPLSYRLATIKRDVDLGLEIEALRRRPADTARLRDLFRRLGFRSWLADLDELAPDPRRDQLRDYQLILDQGQLEAWLDRLRAAPLFAFDTETTSLDYMQARVVGISFAVSEGEAAYVPLGHDYPDAPPQLDRDAVLAAVQPLLEDPGVKKLGHNLKYDRNVLVNHGLELTGIAHDTMLESYVINSIANRHDLDTLCERYLDHRTIHYEDVAGKGAKQIGFNQVALTEAGPYAAEDADMTLRLHHHFWPQLEATEGLKRLYQELEIPLIEVLSRMERNGVMVDARLLARQSGGLAERMQVLAREVIEMAGEPFNLGSTKQLQAILFDKLGLPVIRKTPKGQPSTAEDVLQELARDYPLPRLILEHRSLSKLKSTYTDKLPELINPVTGRVHTSYHQAVASTGRLASAEPNLQNIPIRTETGRRIRQAFVAPPGRLILAADYSQIELRIMAHLSGDEGLRAAFREGQDIHRATAAEVLGAVPQDVTPEQRRAAKAINFGLIYGMSAFGLARQLGIDRGAAQAYIELYFARYPGVRAYMERTREQARRDGYVETLFGRRLYLPEINSRNGQRRQYAERTAINAPMQGTAADIIKRAMIQVDRWLRPQAEAAHMIMQVHDELVFEVNEDDLERVRAKAVGLMTAAAQLSVPLEVEAAAGKNWDEAH
jgi:DNA polymerase-1